METPPPDLQNSAHNLEHSYALPALERVRLAAKGNGLRPEGIMIENFSGRVLRFQAETLLSPHPTITQKYLPGKKTVGEKVGSQQTAQAKIDEEKTRLFSQENIIKIKSIIAERADKGFGLRNAVIKLAFMTREYCTHDTCKTCGGRGDTKCPRCGGKGSDTCPRCNGQGQETCPPCNGNRYIYTGQEKVACVTCNGMGRMPCSTCRQTRSVSCSGCSGRGIIACKACLGEGVNTQILSAEMNLMASWDFDLAGLEEEQAAMIRGLGTEIPVYSEITSTEQNAGENLKILHAVSLPQAKITIKLRENDSCVLQLLGPQAEIINPPAFLEPVLARALAELARAAAGQGDVGATLQSAGRYKTIRQGIMAAAKFSRGKAAQILIKNTPLGISKKTIGTMIVNADTALKNITARPRKKGFVVGLLLTTLLSATYLLAPLRSSLTAFVSNTALHPALDVTVIILGIFCTNLAAQLTGAAALKTTLQKFLPKNSGEKILPKTGMQLFYAAFLCSLAFLVLCEMALRFNTAPPPWYVDARAHITTLAGL